MATAVQRRRGTTAEHAAFTGLAGEVTVDTSKQALVVHDGSTPGGHPAATAAWATAHGGDTEAHGISPFGASLVDDADAETARGTLGLGGCATLAVGATTGTVAAGDHDHAGAYEPADETLLKAVDIGTAPGTVAAGDHDHGGDTANLGSGSASAGQVLTADGSGGASWSAPARITVAATAPENPGLHDCWLDIS